MNSRILRTAPVKRKVCSTVKPLEADLAKQHGPFGSEVNGERDKQQDRKSEE